MTPIKQALHAEPELQELQLSEIKPSTTNPRRKISESDLVDLTKSIEEKGVLVPVIVRPHPKGGYELVAGARRLYASNLAGKPTIPALIRKLTDEQALEVQVIENLQRVDVDPIDEAHGFQQLVDKAKYTHEQIAAKIGKSVAYVKTRMQLLALDKKVVEALEEGKITISHAILLCRLQPKDQAAALKACEFREYLRGGVLVTTSITVKDLQTWIRTHVMLEMQTAPFDTDDANLVPKAGPCSSCPKRTKENVNLFADIASDDRCTDPACFQLKVAAQFAIAKKEFRAKHGADAPLVSMDWSTHKEILGTNDYLRVGAKSCEHATPALVTDGGDRGRTIHICVKKDCKKHRPNSQSGASMEDREASRKREAANKKRYERQEAIDTAILKEIYSASPQRLSPSHLRSLAEFLFDQVSDYQVLVRILQLDVPGGDTSYFLCMKAVEKHLAGLKEMQLPGFIILLLAVSSTDKEIHAYAKELKINVEKIKREVLAAEKKAAAEEKAKQKASAKVAAAGKKSQSKK